MNTAKTNSHYRWVIVAAGFISLFCFSGAGFYSFGVFIKPFEVEFGWSRSSVALTISIYLLMNGLASPLIGRLIQLIGPKKVMLMGACGAGLCFLLISFTQHLLYLYCFYALLAVNIVGIGLVPVSTIIAGWFERQRGTATGLAYTGISVGGLVYAPVIGQINLTYGWRYSFLFLAFIIWVLVIPIALFVIRERPGEKDHLGFKKIPERKKSFPLPAEENKAKLDRTSGVSLKSALSTSIFWGIAITFFLGAMAQMAVLQHQVAIMSEKGITYGLAATALGVTSGMGGIGKFCFGRLSDLFPIHLVVISCYLLQCLGIIILLNLNPNITIWIYAAIFGFGMGGVVVLQPLAVGQFFGLKSFSVILGLITLGQSLGASIGAFSAGVIYDHFNNYHYALITFLMVYAMAIITIFVSGKSFKKEIRAVAR